jgi:hypothetical protein
MGNHTTGRMYIEMYTELLTRTYICDIIKVMISATGFLPTIGWASRPDQKT